MELPDLLHAVALGWALIAALTAALRLICRRIGNPVPVDAGQRMRSAYVPWLAPKALS
jgi:hypothetical protein